MTLLAPAQRACVGHERHVVLLVTMAVKNVLTPQGSGADVPAGQYHPSGHCPLQLRLVSSVVDPKRASGQAVHVAAPLEL
jgi:hypothetical protein